jgi:predicted small secreted protein
MKKFLLLLVMLALSGCNTFQGMGKDIQQGGAAIEKAATK